MAEDVLRTGPHNTMRVLESTAETLLFEATWGVGGDRVSAPPPHLHPAQDEHFEILDGELQAIMGGEERTLRAGDHLDVPAGTVHQMWNGSEAAARATWRVTPPLKTLEFFRTIASGDIPEDFLERFAGEFRLA